MQGMRDYSAALSSGAGPDAELLEQRGLVGLGGLEVAHLDVAEAADLLRDGGEPDREVMVLGRELAENLLEHRLVVATSARSVRRSAE